MDISEAIVDLKVSLEEFGATGLGFAEHKTAKSIRENLEILFSSIINPTNIAIEYYIKLKEACMVYDRQKPSFGFSPNKNLIFNYASTFLKEIEDIKFGRNKTLSSPQSINKKILKKVFIIHGKEVSLADELHRILNEHEIGSVILQNQPNDGRTVLEKLEEEGFNKTDYAIAIVTPDDIGGLNGTGIVKSRARQNVILEIGAFIMKDRNKICILKKGEIEIPSDISGIAYHRFNNKIEEVSRSVLKELAKAGFEISFQAFQKE